jgi:MtrB/PioB family decaheme-associated outer membrane protein
MLPVVVAALALTLSLVPSLAVARQAAQEPEEEPLATVPLNRVDFGVRGTHLTGDGARYERYRDLGDGLFLETARMYREQQGWFLSFSGDHVGRGDQRLTGRAIKPGTLKVAVQWDQIPMLLSRTTQTMFVEASPGVLRVPDLIQSQVEGGTSITSVVGQFARPFDMKTMRHIAQGHVEYLARPDLTLRLNVRNIDRDGQIPFGGSFGHGRFVETPAPIRYDITDVNGNAEFTRGDALYRAGYAFSWFRNEVQTLLFDNPYLLNDRTNLSSTGRFALPPSNRVLSVNGMASYRLPRRTRVTAYASVGSLKDAGDPIVPFTSNTAFPALPLDRPTVNGSALTSSVNLSLSSRPAPRVSVNARYKFFDYDNRTPHFVVERRVSHDSSLSGVLATPFESEPFGVRRHTFDGDVTYTPIRVLTAGVGYSRIDEARSHRIFESTADNVLRLIADAVGYRWFTVRTKYEHARRRGTGIEQGIEMLVAVREQPGMRHYDVAERNRDRLTLIGTAFPLTNLSVNLSVAAGRDDYLNSIFGLLDNKHRVYSIGADATPTEQLSLGLSYSYEDYRALSRSRQASNDAQFNNPAQNWSTDGHDRVHSLVASADVLQIRERLDLRLAYDFNLARALYLYGVGPIADRVLPEETDVVGSSLPDPTQLPLIRSENQRASVDATYSLTDRIGVGATYWRDQYRVRDFSLDAEANPTLDRGNALLIGYVYRPYTANTFWGRLIVRF